MLSHKRLTVAAVLVSIAFVGVAHADDSTVDAPAQPSYRMQLVASDTVAAAAFLGGDALESRGGAAGTTGDVLMATGGAAFLLGGPVIHALHGNYGRGAISLGLRVLLPIIGANIGAAVSGCDKHEGLGDLCVVDDMTAGLLVGAATAAVADALLVAP